MFQALATVFIIALSIVPSLAENPPGILHSTLLNSVTLDYKTGELRINRFTAVFLPEPSKKSKTIYDYNPHDGGELYATVIDEQGNVLTRFDFLAEKKEPPLWIVDNYKVTGNKMDNITGNQHVKLVTGKYNLNFFLEGKQFYRFPFKVTVLQSEDPIAPIEVHMLEGDWNNLGYLYYFNANPEKNIVWKVWLRNVGRDGNEYKNIKAFAELYKGAKLIAVSNKRGYTQNVFPEWTPYDFKLNFPEGSAKGYVKAKDILANDENYTLKMTIDNQPYATWKFEVVNGKLSYKGRTVRGQADPLTFVEGGHDTRWYTKE